MLRHAILLTIGGEYGAGIVLVSSMPYACAVTVFKCLLLTQTTPSLPFSSVPLALLSVALLAPRTCLVKPALDKVLSQSILTHCFLQALYALRKIQVSTYKLRPPRSMCASPGFAYSK